MEPTGGRGGSAGSALRRRTVQRPSYVVNFRGLPFPTLDGRGGWRGKSRRGGAMGTGVLCCGAIEVCRYPVTMVAALVGVWRS